MIVPAPHRRWRLAPLALVAASCSASPAAALSTAAPPSDSVTAQVALDADGRGLAVWAQYVVATDISTIEVAERRRDGTWRAPFRLAWTAGEYLAGAQLAVNARGDAAIMWERQHPSGPKSIDVVTRPAGGEFSAPHELAGPDVGAGSRPSRSARTAPPSPPGAASPAS